MMDKYGPFINIVALTSALVATFSVLLLRMLGNIQKWTWLTSGSPSFLVTAGPRMLAVAFMADIYVTISHANYMWFGAAAILIGIFGFWAVVRFDHLRKLYVVQIPLIGKNGQQIVDKKGHPNLESVVIGLESQMRPEAKTALDKSRRQKGGLSPSQFMAGYGSQKLNDPEAIWDREILASISNKLSILLMYTILSAVMVVFLAAFVIEIAK